MYKRQGMIELCTAAKVSTVRIYVDLSKAFDACELNQSQRAIVIQKRCHEILTNGPFVGTTVKEDLRIAESEEEEEKHRVCARYRVAKKEIYAFPLKKKR